MNSNNSNPDSRNFDPSNQLQGHGHTGTRHSGDFNSYQEGYYLKDGSLPIPVSENAQINEETYATNKMQQPKTNKNTNYGQNVSIQSEDLYENKAATGIREQMQVPGMSTLNQQGFPNCNLSMPQQMQLEHLTEQEVYIPSILNELPIQQPHDEPFAINPNETFRKGYQSTTSSRDLQNQSQGHENTVTENVGGLNRFEQGHSLSSAEPHNLRFTYQDGGQPIGNESSEMYEEINTMNQMHQTRINANYNYNYEVNPQTWGQKPKTSPTNEQIPAQGMSIQNPQVLPYQNLPMPQQMQVQHPTEYDIEIPSILNELPGHQADWGPCTVNPSETLWEGYDSAACMHQPNQSKGQNEIWALRTGYSNTMQQGCSRNESQLFGSTIKTPDGSLSCQNQFPHMYPGSNPTTEMDQQVVNINSDYPQAVGQCGKSVKPDTFQKQPRNWHQPNYSYQNENLPVHQGLEYQTEGPSGASHFRFQTPGHNFYPQHSYNSSCPQQTGTDQPPITHLSHLNVQHQQNSKTEERSVVDDGHLQIARNIALRTSKTEQEVGPSNETTRPASTIHSRKSESLIVNLDDLNGSRQISADLRSRDVQIKSIQFHSTLFHHGKQLSLLSILQACRRRVETLKFKFSNFYQINNDALNTGYTRHLYSFSRKKIKFSRFKNLSTVEFKSIVNVSRRGSTLSDSYKDGVGFYLNLFKEIIKSSSNLKYLVVRSSELAGYLHAMVEDSEIAGKFEQLHTLRIHVERDLDQLSDKRRLLFRFLSIVSHSLEVLHICGVLLTNLSFYPFMQNLKVLCFQLPAVNFRGMSFSTKPFPKLESVIFRYMESLEELNFDFGWPFDGEGGLKLNEERDFLNPFPSQLVNIVLYPQGRTSNCWETALGNFIYTLKGISVECIFIDLTYNQKNIYFDSKLKETYLVKYVGGCVIYRKRCLIRYFRDQKGSPVVLDVWHKK